MLNSVDSALPPKSERPVSLRKPLRQLSLGQDLKPASPLISTRNLVPGLSDSVVKLDRLGKGATSNVFRAVHAATLKMIALKEVTVSNDADRRAVRTEMRALHTQRSPLLTSTFTTELASCPRIVDYYGSVVQENGNACIAVEYVAGGSLGSWLDSGCLCPEAWIAHIAHQALEVRPETVLCLVKYHHKSQVLRYATMIRSPSLLIFIVVCFPSLMFIFVLKCFNT